ncbi:MAG: endonuclease [Bacteroidales bacterium]|jgi:predicted extracellular nuclease|nr:endonuclease [Bacteroidales bacterium]
MKKLLILWFLPVQFGFAQADSSMYCVAFYNVENLFDTYNDSLTLDDDFTPAGAYHWSYKKYLRKVNNISKVLLAMGEGNPPDLVGMAEIENRRVLRQFCYESPLQKFRYGFVHYDSPDRRGIDVALLYRKDRVQILHSEPLPVIFPFDTGSRNRDVLYAVARLASGDTLHLFVNHWTSRYGGYAATIQKRNCYADMLKARCEELWAQNSQANILIMGDFNDYPADESMSKILNAKELHAGEIPDSMQLYNLMFRFAGMANIGTHKHEDFWGCLDQMVVSSALLQPDAPLAVQHRQAEIFRQDFMLEPDEKYGGYKTFRTFLGPRYIGGYGDHLPVFLHLHALRNANPQ